MLVTGLTVLVVMALVGGAFRFAQVKIRRVLATDAARSREAEAVFLAAALAPGDVPADDPALAPGDVPADVSAPSPTVARTEEREPRMAAAAEEAPSLALPAASSPTVD